MLCKVVSHEWGMRLARVQITSTRRAAAHRGWLTTAVRNQASSSCSSAPEQVYLKLPFFLHALEGTYRRRQELHEDLPIWQLPVYHATSAMSPRLISSGGRWQLHCKPGASWKLRSAHHAGELPTLVSGWHTRIGRGERAEAAPDAAVLELQAWQSYAERGQDVHAMGPRVFNGQRNGTFVEVGAANGELGSNTCLMERVYGWTGVCIEARAELLTQLVHNRPASHCVTAALFNRPGLELDFALAGELSGLSCTAQPAQQRRNHRRNVVRVRTQVLSEILDVLAMPKHVDFLSIDTEGSELEVLQGADIGRRSFGYIVLEHNFEEPKRAQIREFLESRSYTLVRSCSVDDEYRLVEAA
eukprot:TRINITY_DN21495_c0_g2_i1.p1 TRINITY_DN21495_c0_g2~~TRINITY_DN21495_c0_g2_i1.p1  ORF type:complete len:358 (+),score=59.22 TRINITY_DN21495_c0_g2_i1:205-1278(+)